MCDTKSTSWKFSVDYNDHFETPLEAYQDINCLLEEMASELQINKKDLTIYDPYFCKGNMIDHMNSLG